MKLTTEELQKKYSVPTGTSSGKVRLSTDELKSKYGQSAPASKPKEDLLTKASGILNTVFPAKNIGEAIGTGIAKATAPKEFKQYVEPSKATPLGIAGDIAQNAALFVGGGAIPEIRAATTLGKIGKGALTGAKTGALAGGISGIGEKLSEGGTPTDAIIGGLKGAATGGLTGGILGGAVPAIPKLAGAIERGGVKSEQAIINEANKAGGNTAGIFDSKLATQLSKNADKQEATAGAILQGKPETRSLGAEILPTIDTKGVKTFSDLSSKIDNEIKASQRIVDSEHQAIKTETKLKDLAQIVSVGEGKTALKTKVNYVEDALKQLKQNYIATGNVKKSLQTQQLLNKAKTKGLTPDEINQIAKEHGKELNAYNLNGELASGLKKQTAESTRQGLKDTARSFLQTDIAKQADKRTSDLLKLKKLSDKMEEAVTKLEQRIKQRGILAKIARSIGGGIDILTGGTIKAFFTKLLMQQNVGQEVNNALDIQNNLSKNLKLLNRLNKAPDSEIESVLRRIIGGK